MASISEYIFAYNNDINEWFSMGRDNGRRLWKCNLIDTKIQADSNEDECRLRKYEVKSEKICNNVIIAIAFSRRFNSFLAESSSHKSRVQTDTFQYTHKSTCYPAVENYTARLFSFFFILFSLSQLTSRGLFGPLLFSICVLRIASCQKRWPFSFCASHWRE